jgi:hypothetical protein
MVQRFTSVSRFVFGPPHTFGWVRCSEIDQDGLGAWEQADGTMAHLPRGAQLARLPGSRSRPCIIFPKRGAK